MMEIEKKENLITKSNDLIEAPYKLTTSEQKLLASVISKIQPEDKDFKIYDFTVNEIAMFMFDEGYTATYAEIERIIKSIRKRVLYIKKEKSSLDINWFSSAEYFKGEGRIELCFDPKLKPYLLQLKERFTSYRINNISKLKSFYSIRIYELLKQYEHLKKRLITIDYLREILCIEDNKYAKYSNFKQKVLNVAHIEINEKTDLNIDFEEIKLGRKVDKIKFSIESKNKPDDLYNSNFDDEQDLIERAKMEGQILSIKNIISEDISDDDAKSLYSIANGNIGKIAEKYFMSKGKNVNNLMGYLIKSIQEDYTQVIGNKDNNNQYKNRFHNFEQRTSKYTAEELENMILENQKYKLGEE